MGVPHNTLFKNEVNSRRSQRVVARIRVEVCRRTDDEKLIAEVTYTLVVNAHGALISLAMEVDPDELLSIKNVKTGNEKHTRVVKIREEQGSQKEVAIEFLEPAPHFWHIDFPPVDWKLASD